MIQLDLKDAVLVEGLHPLFPKAFDYLGIVAKYFESLQLIDC